MAALTFATVLVSVFGMIRLTEYFGVPPAIDFGSQALQYDHRVSGLVMTFMGFLLTLLVLLDIGFSS
jgi:hypothetical protein